MRTPTVFPQRRNRPAIRKDFKGWRGVVASLAPGLKDPSTYLQRATNLRPGKPGDVSGWVPRPGFTRMNPANSFTKDLLGMIQFTKTDGTSYPVGCANGKLFRLDTFADITPGVITINNRSSGPIFLCVFNNYLIVSDGVNAPWFWDGVTANGTYILFDGATNEPAYGQPVVYYGKLFFIRANDRRTFLWCEENTPAVGYVQTGYQDRWTFTQTNQDPLTALFGTNDALYVFRPHSISKVLGAVFPQFSSTGTREAVSETIGTLASRSIISLGVGGAFAFLDQFGRVNRYVPGFGLEAWWMDAASSAANFTLIGTGLEAANATPDADGVVLPGIDIAVWRTGNSNLVLAYTLKGGYCCGEWGFSTAFGGGAPSFGGFALVQIAGVQFGAIATDAGYWYKIDPGAYTDNDGAANPPYKKSHYTHPWPYDESREYILDTVELGLEGTASTAYTLTVNTPRFPGSSNTYSATSGPPNPGFTESIGGITWGLSELGRSFALIFQDSGPTTTYMRFYSVGLGLIPVGEDPLNP